MKTLQLTAMIEREGDGYVGFRPKLDVARQEPTIKDATGNLAEAVSLLLETADPIELQERLHGEAFVTRLEVEVA